MLCCYLIYVSVQLGFNSLMSFACLSSLFSGVKILIGGDLMQTDLDHMSHTFNCWSFIINAYACRAIRCLRIAWKQHLGTSMLMDVNWPYFSCSFIACSSLHLLIVPELWMLPMICVSCWYTNISLLLDNHLFYVYLLMSCWACLKNTLSFPSILEMCA